MGLFSAASGSESGFGCLASPPASGAVWVFLRAPCWRPAPRGAGLGVRGLGSVHALSASVRGGLGALVPGAAGTALLNVNEQMNQTGVRTCSPSRPRPSRGARQRAGASPALPCCLLRCANSSLLATSFCPEPPVRTYIPCAQTLGPPPDPARGNPQVREGPPGPRQG